MQRREVGLDEEEAGRDARLPECAREMVVIGDVERACGPEDRGNGWASRYLRRAWCPSCSRCFRVSRTSIMPTVIRVGHRSATVNSCSFGKCPTPATSAVRARFAEDPTNETLDGAPEPEHEQHQDETRADLAVGTGAARHAEERGHPDGRCGGQAMHAAVTGIAQDHSRAEEADAGEHALGHAADDVRLEIAAA